MPFQSRLILVSVIIPVRNNAEGLKQCLEALRNQSYPAENFEIIVVDNASTEPLDDIKELFPQIKWSYDDGAGSYSARNRGLNEATGEIVAFTDSDCIPDRQWLEHGVAALQNGRGTIIGGNIVLQDPVGRDLNVYELIELVVSAIPDNNRKLVEERGFTATGNMLTYRANFTRWNNFDATLKSAGDRDWVTRAVRNGEKLAYAENVIVRHPRRSALGPLLLKLRRHVGGRVVLLKRAGASVRQLLGELLDFSIFDIRLYVVAFRLPHIKSAKMRFEFLGVGVLVSLIVSAERIWVMLGGSTSRG
jgi:glycosyltransferase involved in cell wall biosynthesis